MNIHRFAYECEGWSKLFSNRNMLKEVGCSAEHIQNLYVLSQELAMLSLQISQLNPQEQQKSIAKVNYLIMQYSKFSYPLFVRKAFQEVQMFLETTVFEAS